MKNTILTLSLAAAMAMASNANAQVADRDLPTWDVVVDRYIVYQDRLDRNMFLDQLVDEFGGDRNYYLSLLDANVITQGELYYACAVGDVAQVACTTVIDHRLDPMPGQSWGVIAQRYGIKPGSQQFHALKDRIQDSSRQTESAAMGSQSGPRGHRQDGMEHGRYGKDDKHKDMRNKNWSEKEEWKSQRRDERSQ